MICVDFMSRRQGGRRCDQGGREEVGEGVRDEAGHRDAPAS